MRLDLQVQAGVELIPLDLPDPFLNLLVQGGGEFVASQRGWGWKGLEIFSVLLLLGAGLTCMWIRLFRAGTSKELAVPKE